MRKIISILLSQIMLLCLTMTGCAADIAETKEIILQIGNPTMTVDGVESNIDPESAETVPVIVDDRTLLPVCAVVEAMGGAVDWNGDTQTVTLVCSDNEITLTIDSSAAYLNGTVQTLDVAPTIINDRTMLPIRFIAESFGYDVEWDANTQEITLIFENTTPAEAATAASTTEPVVLPDLVTESESDEYEIRLTADGQELTAVLYKNSTTDAIVEMLPLTLPMMDLYDREMCYRFEDEFPTDNAVTQSYEVGEIVYWPPGHSFVIMYAQNGERFQMQKLGYIESGVEFFETSGDVDVTIELISDTPSDTTSSDNSDIAISIDGKEFSGILYDNATARQIKENLPLTVSLGRGSSDYCGSVTIDDIRYDEADVTNTYESGDLAYWIPGDDFVIFRRNGTAEGCVIIGKINADSETLDGFGSNVTVTVSEN